MISSRPAGLRTLLPPFLLLFLCLLPAATPARASDFDVVINEVYYNPMSGVNDDEYVELFNRGGTAVDLSGWFFVEGIRLAIPPGVVLEPGEFLLVSPDALHTAARYGIDTPVIGGYQGRLDNGGEVLSLVNAEGEMINRFHYQDGGSWPSRADGLGSSLELTDPWAPPEIPHVWAASLVLDGTPGAPNSRLREPRIRQSERVFIGTSDVWRYLEGNAPYPAGWQSLGFDDGSWPSGPTGIGYGDDDDLTVLANMEGNYLSFAARRRFTVEADDLEDLGDVTLAVDFDDGFVAWLNGTEVARVNLGAEGSPVPYDQRADDTREAGSADLFLIPPALLRVGENVLAVQVHNENVDSSDASFIPSLVGRPVPEPSSLPGEGTPLVLNEARPTEPGSAGFLELYNRSGEDVMAGGFHITDSLGRRATLPGSVRLAPGEFRRLDDSELGFDVRLGGMTYALLGGDGRTIVDSLRTDPGPLGETGFSFGRHPDGDDDGFLMVTPTPGGPNEVDLPDDVVINEIYFHPPFVPPDGSCLRECSDLEQWIELHNRGTEEADLEGWSLTKAVSFDFPAGTRISPGGFLVVAAARDRFLALHPGFDPAMVTGDWTRSLAHDSETINLRDRLGNLVDHVRYGDGAPRNDEEPEDDIDDGTFRGSTWPPDADGSGRTLELVHPELENRFGQSWSEGPVGGTPGGLNASFGPAPHPVVERVTHAPAVPRPTDEVEVTCRISAVGSPVVSVLAEWHRDGGGGSGSVSLRDDGLSGDALPGDGIYGGRLPPQPTGTVVAFQIEARLLDGRSTRVPEPPPVAPYTGFEGPFFLYQVLADRAPVYPSPDYYIVMTAADRAELESRDVQSNVLLPATFIARLLDGEEVVRHVAGIRFRGSATRDEEPSPYRVEFPSDHPFDDTERLNLNSQGTAPEELATDLFRRAGIPAPLTWLVRLTFQGEMRPGYLRKERIDGEFLTRYYGDASDDGNLYRALDPGGLPFEGDLSFLGEDPEEYRPYYLKRTNREEDDYTDIVELTRVFDPVETPDDVFPERLEELVDADQWARFFAVQAAIANEDGGIQNRRGEDYFLYRVDADSNRPDAGLWVLIPWDVEETFDDEDEELFRPTVAAIRRFLAHPRYARLYYCNVMNLRQGVFSRGEMRQRFRLIDHVFGFGTVDSLDSYIAARLGFFDENVPASLSAGSQPIAGDVLVPAGSAWRFFKGTEEPSGGTLEWTLAGFDDAAWLEGPSGFGYGDDDDATVLDDMEDGYTTVYIRHVFDAPDAAALASLELRVDYDDGFVAFLNGVEVARREMGSPGEFVPFDGTASDTHEAGEPEVIDISEFLDLLVADGNVLSLQGANADAGSSDFSLIPELREGSRGTSGLGCGETLYALSDVVGIGGRSNACDTASVRVNGQPVAYDPFGARWTTSVAVEPGENLVRIEAFDLLGAPLDTLDLVVRRVEGVTRVSGDLAGDVTWTAAASPYLLGGDVTVAAGARLTIEPGTVVIGGNRDSIIVQGRIESAGTAPDPVRFLPAACDDRWGGIGIEDTGAGPADPTHLLRFTSFEYGDTPSGFAGCVAPVGSRVRIERCSFRNISANAVEGVDSHVEVRGCFFENIHEGVHCTRSNVIVTDSEFHSMIGDRDAIDFDLNGTERSLIARCLFMTGSDDGIDLGGTTVDIRDNVFVGIMDKAISLEGNGPLGPPTVTGNLIVNSGTAIALKNGVTVEEGHHNTLVGNQEGISLFAKAGASDGGHGTFHSMIVWNNAVDVKLDDRSSVSFSHSNISQEVWPGTGNISADPRFTDVPALDFSLRPGSPSIGTGRDGTDMGAIPSGDSRTFIRGDVDDDGAVNLTDAIRTLDFLFKGAPGAACRDRMDTNDDGAVDISDPIQTLLFLFAAGGEPRAPYPEPGVDPTADGLECR